MAEFLRASGLTKVGVPFVSSSIVACRLIMGVERSPTRDRPTSSDNGDLLTFYFRYNEIICNNLWSKVSFHRE